MLMAGLLIALSAPANAATNQLSGTAFFNPSEGEPCPEDQPAYSSYDPIVMMGSLDGCWYTHIETSRTTPGGVYLETGQELFVGSLNGGPTGTFTTTYKFEAKLNAVAQRFADAASTRSLPAAELAASQVPLAELISRTSSETPLPTC